MELFVDTPKLDKIELASILKDFNSDTDPLLSNAPPYYIEIIKEMLQTDLLLVIGRGLGLKPIIMLFTEKIKAHAPYALVFIIGKPEDDDINGENIIGFGLTSKHRSQLYMEGGIYTISAPILIMDILNGVLKPETVSGLIIPHAERVTEHCPASFAIELLRKLNPISFCKAFSDKPERICMSPPLPLKLRILNVKSVMLYPRFHLSVDKSLPQLQVEEVIIEQPPSVRRQQVLLSELVSAVLSDIKRRVPHLDVDFLNPTLGNTQPMDTPDHLYTKTSADSLLSVPDLSFKIRNALQGVWHKLSYQGRQSVYALSNLQQLQTTLIQFDALTFYTQLYLASQDTEQLWVDLPATSALLAEARRSAVLDRKPSKYEHLKSLVNSMGSEKVLVVCKSLRSVLGLQEYLTKPVPELNELKEREREMELRDELAAKKRAEERANAVNEGRPGRRRVRGTKRVKTEVPSGATGSVPSSADSTIGSAPDSADSVGGAESVDLVEIFDNEPQLQTMTLNNITFMTYSEMSSIEEYAPENIIMYDPSLSFTREIERYAINNKVNVYFMYYQQSVEELQYLTELRKEKDSFSKLIKEKGHMPMEIRDEVEDTEPQFIGQSRRTYNLKTEPSKVIVDSREFRSALPQLIYQNKIDVIPMTLLVGDYIVTPETCVERKSVADLISSFRSGRLFAQCEAMLKHYKTCVLLIEFDNLAHFSMEPFKDIRLKQGAKVQREVQDNIVSLLTRFPKLKLIWSASPVHTAQIFKTLKEHEEEPDVEKVAMAGQTVLFDSVALSMLEAMPGISVQNAKLLTGGANTMKELVNLTKEEMIKLLGTENGGNLYDFVNHVNS